MLGEIRDAPYGIQSLLKLKTGIRPEAKPEPKRDRHCTQCGRLVPEEQDYVLYMDRALMCMACKWELDNQGHPERVNPHKD